MADRFLVHAYPASRRSQPWCYAGKRTKKLGGGGASKLLRRITCPECRAKIAAFLAWLKEDELG